MTRKEIQETIGSYRPETQLVFKKAGETEENIQLFENAIHLIPNIMDELRPELAEYVLLPKDENCKSFFYLLRENNVISHDYLLNDNISMDLLNEVLMELYDSFMIFPWTITKNNNGKKANTVKWSEVKSFWNRKKDLFFPPKELPDGFFEEGLANGVKGSDLYTPFFKKPGKYNNI